jgi:hypothetical protein
VSSLQGRTGGPGREGEQRERVVSFQEGEGLSCMPSEATDRPTNRPGCDGCSRQPPPAVHAAHSPQQCSQLSSCNQVTGALPVKLGRDFPQLWQPAHNSATRQQGKLRATIAGKHATRQRLFWNKTNLRAALPATQRWRGPHFVPGVPATAPRSQVYHAHRPATTAGHNGRPKASNHGSATQAGTAPTHLFQGMLRKS